jgi:hypothetical protein
MALKVFRWIDFLTFGLLGIVVTAVIIYAELAAVKISLTNRILLSLLGVLFWAPYAIVIYFRSKGKGAP